MRKLIYAAPTLEGVTLEVTTKDKEEILVTLKKITQNLAFKNPAGLKISITVELDEWAFERPIFSNARAKKITETKYAIEIGMGLVAQLRVLAMAIASDKTVLRAHSQAKLISEQSRGIGRTEAIGTFVFHYMVMFIFWHELAHIALGHLDWLGGQRGLNSIEEFGVTPLTDNECEERRVIEADADRQASKWTAGAIDLLLKSNEHIRYSNKADAIYDLGYTYGAFFQFLESLESVEEPKKKTHPDAQTRLGITLSFVQDFLEAYYPDASKILQDRVYKGGVASLKDIIHKNKKSFDIFNIAAFIYKNGDAIKRLDIRKLQHVPSPQEQSSFLFST
jgi:hypothetical protein